MLKSNLFLLCFLIWSLTVNAQSTTVGTTDGVFNVSDLGGAAYSIPLKTPKGIGEMQPSLALTYNSQGSNGIMGTGWSLTAGSSITRTGSNIYNDSKVNAAEVSYNDKFMLDGNRLILVSTTQR